MSLLIAHNTALQAMDQPEENKIHLNLSPLAQENQQIFGFHIAFDFENPHFGNQQQFNPNLGMDDQVQAPQAVEQAPVLKAGAENNLRKIQGFKGATDVPVNVATNLFYLHGSTNSHDKTLKNY